MTLEIVNGANVIIFEDFENIDFNKSYRSKTSRYFKENKHINIHLYILSSTVYIEILLPRN